MKLPSPYFSKLCRSITNVCCPQIVPGTQGLHQGSSSTERRNEFAINNKKHHLQLTNDYPWSSSYSTRERESDVGYAWSFLLTLIAFAAEDNIIISSCRPRSTQLANNKPSWTEACEATLLIPVLFHFYCCYLLIISHLLWLKTDSYIIFIPFFSLATKAKLALRPGNISEGLYRYLCSPHPLTRWWRTKYHKLSCWVLVRAVICVHNYESGFS